MTDKKPSQRQQAIIDLCDGILTSAEIASALGDNAKYVQRTMKIFQLPRLARGSRHGKSNHQFQTGRRIDRDGYALVTAPTDHPYSRKRTGRNVGVILEHRLILEQRIGRYLLPTEIVDHIDGLHLHNHPDNLRLFESNADHLRATIANQIPEWSEAGLEKMRIAPSLRKGFPPVNKYAEMKKSGDARLRQILLCLLQLGIDSPYLLGTIRHLEKAGISDLSQTSLERALDDLCRKYA